MRLHSRGGEASEHRQAAVHVVSVQRVPAPSYVWAWLLVTLMVASALVRPASVLGYGTGSLVLNSSGVGGTPGYGLGGGNGDCTNVCWVISASFDPASGDPVTWTFAGTNGPPAVGGEQTTGLFCDGDYTADDVLPRSTTTHDMTIAAEFTSCVIALQHTGGYSNLSGLQGGGSYEWGIEPTPTPSPTASPTPDPLDEVTVVGWSEDVEARIAAWEDLARLGIFGGVVIGCVLVLTAAWVAMAQLRR